MFLNYILKNSIKINWRNVLYHLQNKVNWILNKKIIILPGIKWLLMFFKSRFPPFYQKMIYLQIIYLLFKNKICYVHCCESDFIGVGNLLMYFDSDISLMKIPVLFQVIYGFNRQFQMRTHRENQFWSSTYCPLDLFSR